MRYLFSAFLLLLFAGNVFAQVADFSRNSPYLLENQGQVSNSDGTPAEQVLFSMNTPGIDFYLTKSGITYVFKHGVEDETPASELFPQDRPAPLKEVQWHRVDATPMGASIDKNNIEISYSKTGTVSIFNQLVPQGLEHIRPVESVTFKNIYPGIDWQFVVQEDFLKYNFILHPGADVSQIQMLFEGQDRISLNDNSLLIETSLGMLKENKIESFTSSGETVNVNAILENNILTYHIENAPALKENESLIIDPPLVWGTYYGGSLSDVAIVMERNNNGFIYVLLEIISTDFPGYPQGGTSYYQGSNAGNTDVMISKFTEDGIRVWSTFYGGTGVDKPNNLFYNGTILLVVGGTSSLDFPTMNYIISGAYFDGTINGSQDGFILAFGPLDTRVWATYFGSSTSNSNEKVNDCAFDGSRIFIVGQTWGDAADFPLLPNGTAYYQTQPNDNFTNVFISEFNTNFNLVWSTMLAGTNYDSEPFCDIDSSGRLCLSYQTASSDIPLVSLLPGCFSQPYSGDVDFGITMFNTSRNIIWSTYYGGLGRDLANDIICDFNDGWLLTGSSASTDFPVVNNIGAGFYQSIKGTGTTADAVLLRFSNNGEQQYSSYYGGNFEDAGKGITLDSHKNLYMVGYARSNNLTVLNPMDGSFFQNSNIGGGDEFLIELDSNFTLKWATYLGGTNYDELRDVRVSPSDHVFAVGYTRSSNHPLFDLNPGVSYFDNTIGSASVNDAVIMKFIPCPENFNTITGLDSVCYGFADTLVSTGGFTYAWSTGSTNDSLIQTITADTSYIVTATHLWGCVERDTFVVKVKPLPVISFTGDSSVCLNDSMYLGVSGGISYLWENGFSTDSIAFLPAASEYLTVDVTNSYGCTVRDSIQTTVYPLPVPLITGDNTPCLHDTTTISVSGGDTYLWNTAAITASIDIPWNNLGTYDYYVIATDANGCFDTAFFSADVQPLPEFNLGPDTTICDLTSITLTPGITGASYDWSTGAATQTIIVGTADTYILEVTGTNGCKYADSILVAIQPYPVIAFGGDSTVCYSHPITITASGGATYAWENGLNGASITFTPTVSDTLTVVVTDIYSCSSTDSVDFEVLPLPVPSIAGSTELCASDTTTLTASGGVSYQWSTGQNTAAANFSPSSAGLLNCYVVATGSNGCYDTAYHQITVYALPVIDLGVDTTICESTTLVLDAGNAGAGFIWNTSDISQTISVSVAGTYAVTVTDSHTCANSDTIQVGTTPYADATISDVAFVCVNGSPFEFSAAETGGTWSGDGITNSANGLFNPAVAGVGTATVVYSINGMCGDTDSSVIEVGDVPFIEFVTTDETCPGLNDGTLILIISGGTAPYTSTLGGTPVPDTATNIAPGHYLLTVTDNRGCFSTDSVTIIAEDTPCGEVDFYIPNIFSPNGDLENDVLYVRSNFVESLSWFIYDRFGEKVFQSKDISLGWDGEYAGQPVQSGVYYWYIKAVMIDGTVIEREGNVTVVR